MYIVHFVLLFLCAFTLPSSTAQEQAGFFAENILDAFQLYSPTVFVSRYTAQSAKTQSPFFDFKCQATLLTIAGLAIALRMLLFKCYQPRFEIIVVGLHLNHTAVSITINDGCLLAFDTLGSNKASRYYDFPSL